MIENFKLERYLSKYEFDVPHLLCCSDCETLSVGELLAMECDFTDELSRLRLGYTDALGHPALREEITKLYETASTEDILVFSGAEEGIFAFMHSALKAGNHIIVQFPAYQSLLEVAGSIGCEVTRWKLPEENAWQPDVDSLKKLIKINTKLIVINFPHNPTGSLINREGQQAIIDLARENGLALFSDEVYRFSEYDENDLLPGMYDLYENSLSLGVMSKSFGLAGLRIGWIASKNRKILEGLVRIKDYTTICNSAPSELLSIMALRQKQKILARNRKIIADNLVLLEKFFDQHQDTFKWLPPKGGPVAFPRLESEPGSEKFCDDLREKAGVLLLPSSVFDFGDSHFRIGFGRKNMTDALTRLEEYIENR